MNRPGFVGVALCLALVAVVVGQGLAQGSQPGQIVAQEVPLGSAITYQGQLTLGGSPVNGVCSFQFRLFDAPSGGTQIGPTVLANAVSVANGLFTVLLDFGSSAFPGQARWLEVAVMCSGATSFTTLAPLQPLAPVPYALYAASAGSVLTGPVGAGAWLLAGNAGTNPATNFLGTTDNVAFEVRVNNARSLRLEPNATSPNVIGGFSGNVVTPTAVGATIGGGGDNSFPNRVTIHFATVGGGRGNRAGAVGGPTLESSYATVGGGAFNVASEYAATVGGGDGNKASGHAATVSGGQFNTVSGVQATLGGGFENIASGGLATVSGGYSNTASGHSATVGGGIQNTASMNKATVGGGEQNTASGLYGTVAGGRSNYSSGGAATVPGGDSNTAQGNYSFAAGRQAKANHQGAFVWADSTFADFASTANDQFAVRASGGVSLTVVSGGLRLEPNATSPNVIGGFSGNVVTPTVVGATIGGGGLSGLTNRVTDDYGTVGGGANNQAGRYAWMTYDQPYATVGGGKSNTASNMFATVGGGRNNTASNVYVTVSGGEENNASGQHASVGGGRQNTASGSWAVIGGGYGNTANNEYATVGGGWINTASGSYATVSGGRDNLAQGAFSFAAGRRAKANHAGALVWADSTDADFASTANDQLNVRASGGARVFSNSGATMGVQLAAGGNAWSALSDRNLKENITPVDEREILRRLSQVPISEWNLKGQEPANRHIGPMAQDFYAAFGVGEDDRHISTVDADGVALAAIQGLYQLVQEKDAQIAALEGRLAKLEALLAR